ncbi:peptidoglycan bridge formation glycyltransferase FemA/FemB family protein [Candidatus Micrarchaeota archaeon]|nr:peptidoglycan bridge formation glycyltransferase FemA/FemB family protein [Candidatus Micrarchaeota archaeon]
MEFIAKHAVDSGIWDTFVESNPEGTFFQTTRYSDAMNDLHQSVPVFFTVEKNGRTCAALLALKEGYGEQAFEKTAINRATKPLLRASLATLRWHQGPLVLPTEEKTPILRAMIGGLNEYCKKNRIFLAEGSLPVLGNSDQDAVGALFCEADFTTKPAATFIIDLADGEEKRWEKLDKAAKKAVLGCKMQNIDVVRASTEDDVNGYQELLGSFRKKMGLHMPPFYPNLDFWKKNKGKTTDIYLAHQEKKLVSAMGVVYCNGLITEVAVARDLENKAYAQDAIKWKIIQWGAENNYRFYDLAGVNPDPKTAQEKGAYQFKSKWGGKLVRTTEVRMRHPGFRDKVVNRVKNGLKGLR